MAGTHATGINGGAPVLETFRARVPKGILTGTFAAFMTNDLTTSAAAVSYFSMVVLFPSLLFVLTIGSRILGESVVERYAIEQVLEFLPGAHAFVTRNLRSISNLSTGVLATCLLVILWAASWLFTVIEKALNRVWGTYPRSFLHGRAVNFAVMMLTWTLLGASALITASVTGMRAAASRMTIARLPWLAAISGLAWEVALVAGSLCLTIALFTIFYKFLPNKLVPWSEAVTGGLVAGVLWEIAKFGFAILLPYFDYDLLYGSIGAAVALLTWVYLSSLIMLFGAQFTALLHRSHLPGAAEG